MTIQNIVLYSELIAAITGTIYFYKYNQTQLKYFLYLLWFITFCEFFATIITTFKIDQLLYVDENEVRYNLWIYNLLYFIFFNSIYFIYLKSVHSKKSKLWIKIFMMSYIVVSIFNWSFLQKFFVEMSELPYVLGSLFLLIIIIFYFIELLKSDQIVVFHKLLLFWVSVGLLLFHTGTIPFAINTNSYSEMPYVHDLFHIIYILAIAMYLIFIFGFIWSKRE